MHTIHITIANIEDIQALVRSASDRFQGATAVLTYGGWTDEDGKFWGEPGIRITLTAPSSDAIPARIVWAKAYARALGEQAIFIENSQGEAWIEITKKGD